VRLAEWIDWPAFEGRWGALLDDRRGAPNIVCLLAGIQDLKHVYKLSDEGVVRWWVENPDFRYFIGNVVLAGCGLQLHLRKPLPYLRRHPFLRHFLGTLR